MSFFGKLSIDMSGKLCVFVSKVYRDKFKFFISAFFLHIHSLTCIHLFLASVRLKNLHRNRKAKYRVGVLLQ